MDEDDIIDPPQDLPEDEPEVDTVSKVVYFDNPMKNRIKKKEKSSRTKSSTYGIDFGNTTRTRRKVKKKRAMGQKKMQEEY